MSAPKLRNLYVLALLILLSLLPNLAHLSREVIYDDQAVVVANTAVAAGDYVKIWTSPYWAGLPGVYQQENLHRPLFLSVASLLRNHVGLLRVFVSISHGLAGYLLFLCLIPLVGTELWLAWAAAALFVVHPAQVEVTAQMIGLMEIWPTLLGLTALLCLPRRPRLALALVAIAPAWKEIGFVWLGGFVLLFLYQRRYVWATVSGGIVAFWLAMRFWIYGALFSSQSRPYWLLNPLSRMDFVDGFWTRFALLGHQLRLFFAPFKLSCDYSWGTLPFPGYTLQVWVLLAVGFLVYVWSRRATITAITALALATILPTLHLTGPTGIVFAERFGYTFRLGLIVLAMPVLMRGWKRIKSLNMRTSLQGAVFAVVAIAYGLTWQRYAEWETSERLFSTDLARYPWNGKLHFNLAMVYGSQQRWQEAQQQLAQTLALAPDFPEAHYRMGLTYRELHDETRAQQEWRMADELGFPMRRGQGQ